MVCSEPDIITSRRPARTARARDSAALDATRTRVGDARGHVPWRKKFDLMRVDECNASALRCLWSGADLHVSAAGNAPRYGSGSAGALSQARDGHRHGA